MDMDYSLADGRIDVWPVHVAVQPCELAEFERYLDQKEVAKARLFRFEHLRQRYAVIHGLLRILLGRYLREHPTNLLFSTGPNGKPRLEPLRRIQFNISHSDDIALFGFTTGCEIGVDVEKLRPVDDFVQIARRFFSPDETNEVMSTGPEDLRPAFFRCWTRKEAYLKAVGAGLQTPLDSFRVSINPPEPARLIHVNGSPEAAATWTLESIDSVPCCAAAVAYRSPRRKLHLMPLVSPASFLSQQH
jgi:4'-phosphopantetheinyl transferase